MDILTFVGGISTDSINRKLYAAVKKEAPRGFSIEAFNITKLPFFSQDLEVNPPDAVIELRSRVKEADGILFITPEYNRSIPGVLKNAIDWGSRPYGQNSFDRKPTAVMGASVGNIGTFGAQHHLRQVLAYLNMPTMGQPEFYLNATNSFDESGVLADESTKKHIVEFWAQFSEWLLHFREKREERLTRTA